jgi:rhamnose utilization protein RhaD (predicted bifunctional aldolase and dehydrogenase)
MSGKQDRENLSGSSDRAAATPFALPRNRWDAAIAQQKSPAELLQYRSNLLGSDLTVTNYGGGNTSAKLIQPDPLTGQDTEVLWVKGSGGDIGSMGLDGFATLYLAKLQSLERLYRGLEHEDDMVDYLPHCTFNLNTRAASIDTPLHALLPFTHVDHVHPDAMIALAAAADGEQATQAIWSGSVGWLPWQRPGFDLGLRLRDYVSRSVASQPNLRGVMLAGHGVICWGDTAQACYDNTISLIADAARYLNTQLAGKPAFGGVKNGAVARRGKTCRRVPADAAPARPDERWHAEAGALFRRRGNAGVRLLTRLPAPGRHWHLLPRSLPAHENCAAGAGRTTPR